MTEIRAEIDRIEKILGNPDRREEKKEIFHGNVHAIYESLDRIQNELKSTVNGKIYLVNFFDDLRNQIDIECQLYLIKTELTRDDKAKAVQTHQNMVDEVDRFQKQCLANLESNPEAELKLEEQNLRSFDLKDKQVVSKLEKELYTKVYNRKKFLFVNQGILFFNTAKYGVLFKRQKCPQFGVLVLIQDEFLIYSDKISICNDDYTFSHDWCNELLRLQQMCHAIAKHQTQKTSAIVALRLRLNQLQLLDLSFFYQLNENPLLRSRIDMYLTKWAEDLPALTKVDMRHSSLDDLIPPTFFKATNLNSIDLGFNEIEQLHPLLFYPCQNLKVLRLNNNNMTSLNLEVLNGLEHLTTLDLSENKLTVLPKGLFKGLVHLESLDAKGNLISTIAEGLFKDLVNLEVLDLSCNKIRFLYGNGFFRGLTKLDRLCLRHNRINSLPEGLFQDLGDLTVLDLGANQIGADQIGASTFGGLGKLRELKLYRNDISALSMSVFKSLSKLRCLCIGENEVKLIGEEFFEDRASKQKRLVCTVCGGGKARSCSKCKSARYCSKECQVYDWPSHKYFCVPSSSNTEN